MTVIGIHSLNFFFSWISDKHGPYHRSGGSRWSLPPSCYRSDDCCYPNQEALQGGLGRSQQGLRHGTAQQVCQGGKRQPRFRSGSRSERDGRAEHHYEVFCLENRPSLTIQRCGGEGGIPSNTEGTEMLVGNLQINT